MKSQLIGKDPDAEGRRTSGHRGWEMAGWPYRLNGHESEQTVGDSEGQGSLACCSPWGPKETQLSD